MKKTLAAFFSAGVLMTAWAEENLRSVKDIMLRAKQGKAVSAVFFGGSLSWGSNASNPNETSWRGCTMQMLRERYPKTPWRFYDGCIGGTGTDLAVFRLQRDVLAKKPDLVFLEFTLNDGLEGTSSGIHDSKNQSYEAILRTCLQQGIAVLPVFLTSKKYVTLKDVNTLKRRLQHIEICCRYNLDYADVLGLMNRDYQNGKLDIRGFWPKEIGDTTHPQDPGYKEYADYFAKEWDRIGKKSCGKPVIPEAMLSGNGYTHIRRIDAPEMKFNGAVNDYFSIQADTFDWMASRWLDRVVMIGNADHKSFFVYKTNGRTPAPLKFSFYGERIAITAEVIRESVPLLVKIDDDAAIRTVKFRNVQRSQFQTVELASGLDPEKLHTVTITLKLPEDGSPGVLRLGSIHLNGRSRAEIVSDRPSF